MFDSLSFKTPTNVEKCHINEAKYFLNIFYTYQDFRLGGFMFHRAIDWPSAMISHKVYIRRFWFELDNGNFKDFFPYQLVGFTTKTDARRSFSCP